MKKPTRLQKGAVGGLLAITLLSAGIPASTARANTSLTDLQAQIAQLMAQLEALRNGNGATCTPFTIDLQTGRSGADVTRLQQFLINRGHTIPAGATGFFGEQTRQALASYQRSENINPAVGFFGPMTRASINARCATPPTTPTTPGSSTTTPTTPALRGEASFRDFSLRDGDDTNLEEGDTNRPIADIEFTTEDGDATLQRIDIVFTPDAMNNEKDPWDTFSEVTIWDGGDRIARIDTSRRAAWRDENRSTGAYTLRANNLNYVLKEDSETNLTIQVSTARNIRGAEDGENWTVAIPNNGIRALDASRVVVETGDLTETVAVTIEEAGTADELLLRSSSSDPDSTTLMLERNNRSGFTTVFAFDIDTDGSANDIEIRRLPVTFTLGSSTFNTFVRDARITIDGRSYTRKAIVDGSTGTVNFEFRSNELVIDAGDRVTAVVELDFKALPEVFEGTTINGRIDAANILAEGADDLVGNQLKGVITGDIHRLQTTGAVVTPRSNNAVVTSSNGSTNDYATFRIEVDVTAKNQDLYIPSNSSAVTFALRDATGATITATSTAVVSSNAREQGSYLFIPEGETKSLTLEVTYQPQVALTSARLQLLSIEYAATATTPTNSWSALPANRFQTNVVTIVD